MGAAADAIIEFKRAKEQEAKGGIKLPLVGDEAMIARIARTQEDLKIFGGGPLQKFSDVLLLGQYSQVAVSQKVLEAVGFLEPTDDEIGDLIKKRYSNSDLLTKIGKETGKGGLLTGRYKATQSVFHNFLRELPRATVGLAADILLDPMTYLFGFGLVQRALKPFLRPVARVAKLIPGIEKAGGYIGKKFLLPSLRQSPELRAASIQRKVAEREAYQKAAATIKPTVEMSPGMQQRIAQVVKGGITTDEEIIKLASPIRKIIDDLGTDISKISPEILNELTIESKKGQYLGRFFTAHLPDEAPERAYIALRPLLKVSPARFIRRKNFAEGIQKSVKDFFDLLPAQRKVVQNLVNKPEFQRAIQVAEGGITTDLEVATYVKRIAGELPGLKTKELNQAIRVDGFLKRNTEFLKPSEFFAQPSLRKFEGFFNERMRKSLGEIKEISLPGFQSIADLGVAKSRLKFFDEIAKVKKLVSDLPFENWEKFPVNKFLGRLSDKYVAPEIMEEIQRIQRFSTELETVWSNGLRFWKASKTAFNPATISRNDITNLLILNPLGGLPPWRVDIYAKTMQQWFRKGPLLKRAEAVGLQLSTQEVAELRIKSFALYNLDRRQTGTISKFFPTAQKFYNKVLNFYGAQDRFFKLANFIKGVTDDGLTDLAAMQRANFYLIDYSDIPETVRWLRNTPIGVPFISFTYGVSFPLAKTLATRPDQLANYFKVINSIRTLNPYQISREARENEEKVLPDWLKRKPKMLLPFRDEFGNRQFLDLEYIMPFNVFETMSFMPAGPFLDIITAIKTNVDPFTRREIIPDGTSFVDSAELGTKFLYRMWAPSILPGGFGFDKLLRSIQKKPEKISETPRGLTSTLLDVFGGLRAFPINPDIAARKTATARYFDIQDIKGKIRAIRKQKAKGFLSEEEEAEQIDSLMRKMRLLINPNDALNR